MPPAPRVRQVTEAEGAQRGQPADHQVAPPDLVVETEGQASRQHEEGGADEGGVDQRAQDLEIGDEDLAGVQSLGQAHEAPGQQQVPEEPHPVRGVEIGEDQELDRQGQGGDQDECLRDRH